MQLRRIFLVFIEYYVKCILYLFKNTPNTNRTFLCVNLLMEVATILAILAYILSYVCKQQRNYEITRRHVYADYCHNQQAYIVVSSFIYRRKSEQRAGEISSRLFIISQSTSFTTHTYIIVYLNICDNTRPLEFRYIISAL